MKQHHGNKKQENYWKTKHLDRLHNKQYINHLDKLLAISLPEDEYAREQYEINKNIQELNKQEKWLNY